MMTGMHILTLAFIAGASALAVSAISAEHRLPWRHRRNIRRARRVIRRVGSLDDRAVIVYLRKIDPYVFEEVVLEAFRRKGWTVYHNRRYSGDGGIDGRIRRGRRTYIVQCKRYSGHIRVSDVRSFAIQCRVREVRGAFVHTGHTGKSSRDVAAEYPELEIWSGSRLAELIRGNGGGCNTKN